MVQQDSVTNARYTGEQAEAMQQEPTVNVGLGPSENAGYIRKYPEGHRLKDIRIDKGEPRTKVHELAPMPDPVEDKKCLNVMYTKKHRYIPKKEREELVPSENAGYTRKCPEDQRLKEDRGEPKTKVHELAPIPDPVEDKKCLNVMYTKKHRYIPKKKEELLSAENAGADTRKCPEDQRLKEDRGEPRTQVHELAPIPDLVEDKKCLNVMYTKKHRYIQKQEKEEILPAENEPYTRKCPEDQRLKEDRGEPRTKVHELAAILDPVEDKKCLNVMYTKKHRYIPKKEREELLPVENVGYTRKCPEDPRLKEDRGEPRTKVHELAPILDPVEDKKCLNVMYTKKHRYIPKKEKEELLPAENAADTPPSSEPSRNILDTSCDKDKIVNKSVEDFATKEEGNGVNLETVKDTKENGASQSISLYDVDDSDSGELVIDLNPDVFPAEPCGEKVKSKPGRKRNDHEGPRLKRMRKEGEPKTKVYKRTPILDPVKDKKHLNAQNAEKHQDMQKKAKEELLPTENAGSTPPSSEPGRNILDTSSDKDKIVIASVEDETNEEGKLVIDLNPNVTPAEACGEKPKSKRGRKRKYPEGQRPKRRRCIPKTKVYEMDPIPDPVQDKKRLNALYAKKHRDMQKKEKEELRDQLKKMTEERDEQIKLVEELRRSESRLQAELMKYRALFGTTLKIQ